MFQPEPVSHVYLLDTGIPGPVVSIMGGIHGDEICGVQAHEWMKESFPTEYKLLKGKLFILLGNPGAVEKGIRFVERDMNRSFGDEVDDHYETKRAAEIKPILQQSDYLLDIHSTSKPSVPLTCSSETEMHLWLASRLNVQYRTTGWEGRVQGIASDQFVDLQGGIGITVECGSHNDPGAFDVAREAILRFLEALDLIQIQFPERDKKPTHVRVVETVYPLSEDFQFTDDFESFDSLSRGTVYARDGQKEYVTDDNYLIVMPSKKIRKGVEACFLGRTTRLF